MNLVAEKSETTANKYQKPYETVIVFHLNKNLQNQLPKYYTTCTS